MTIHFKYTDILMKNRMNICNVDLWHAQTTKTTKNKTKIIQDYLGGSSVKRINMLTPTGIITPVRVNELIPRECLCLFYAQRVNLFGMRAVLCLLPAPYITMCNFLP